MMPAVEKVTVWVVVHKHTGEYLGAASRWWVWSARDSGSVRYYESETEAQAVRDLLPMAMQKHAARKPKAIEIERFYDPDRQSGVSCPKS